MNMLRRSVGRAVRSRIVPYVALYAVLLALHLQFTLGTGDDPMYAAMLDQYSLAYFSLWHYYTWSARTLIEAVVCIVEALPAIVWRLADPLYITLCAACIVRLARLEDPPCGPLGRLRAGAVLSVAGYEQRRLGVYHAGVRVAFAGGIGGAAAAGEISAGKQAAGMAVCRGAAAYPVRRQHGAAGGSADASAAGIPGLVPVGASAAPLAGVGAAWAVRGQYRLCTHLSGHSAAVRQ